MRLARSRLWCGLVFCAALLLGNRDTRAEPTKSPQLASEWEKGKKFAPTRSELYRLAAGTTVRLSANSVLEVQAKVLLPAGVEGLTPYAYAAQLTQGRVDVHVDPTKKPAAGVMISGPRRASVLARGGRLAVAVSPAGMAVGVFEGRDASVGIGSVWKQIPAGNMLAISARAPQGIESKLLPAPTHVTVTHPVIALDGLTQATRATWDPVPGAQRYLLQLVHSGTNAHKRFEATETSAALTGLAPGKYSLRVSAVETIGIDGMPSEPAVVNVVGVELPPGAFVSQGKICIEPSQQIALTNVEGLEATYDSAPVYFKATNRVGLHGTQSTTLHLRIPGSTERTSVEIIPRALHTSVEIFPAAARWPRDKVVVRIELPSTADGVPPIEIVPTVTVNSHPVEVGWTRSTQRLEAVIAAPPVYPGPWILRAEVADQHGILLGRNFLEIASMAGVDEAEVPREIHRGGD